MFKYPVAVFLLIVSLIFSIPAQAESLSSFISVVNPVRGKDFWEEKDQKPLDAVLGQWQILQSFNVFATWLLRFDVLSDPEIPTFFKSLPPTHEIGLFLEVTPSWTKKSAVEYRKSAVWHLAESVFLTGYEIKEREKLIDTAFAEFKKTFGFYPKSVGAWYVDSFSLKYLQEKYKVMGVLIVSDQYTTDNYQIWGQYWSTPYYPSSKNTLVPAQNIASKIPLVVMQWAARDPINGYGEGVNETTYSVQANDYLAYHDLDSIYFSKLIDIFTKQNFNKFNHLIVGLENSYSWKKYKDEYQKQIEILANKRKEGQFLIFTMQQFADWYMKKFPDISLEQIIISDDPLGSSQKVVWFMNPYYRAGWFYNSEGSVFRDIRQYLAEQEEPCYKTSCQQINFATFSTRVLDDVTYKQKLILDQGKIQDFKIEKTAQGYLLSYKNEAGVMRKIEFFPRDIAIDGKINSIDGLILDVQTLQSNRLTKINLSSSVPSSLQETFLGFVWKTIKFLVFVLLALFIPGYFLVRNLKQDCLALNVFLSICSGFVNLTLVFYLAGYLKLNFLVWIYLGTSIGIFLIRKYYQQLHFKQIGLLLSRQLFSTLFLVSCGTVFQSLMMMRSGWVYDFGVGFWGPTGHDGVWHQALINQLIKSIPPQNPAFAGQALSNYHYFYDLLVAATAQFSQIPIPDLLYRFYPLIFSLLFGVGTYLLVKQLTGSKIAALISLYFAYFAGSFGWIVDLLKKQPLGGESAFWANQPVSMNINPPFAISLILIIAIILILKQLKRSKFAAPILLILMVGSLIEFKVYAGIIVLGGLLLIGLQQIFFAKSILMFKLFIGSLVLSLGVFLPQNSRSGDLLVFSPFWFIHSMIDFSDRIGWERLSIARPAYIARGEWWKFILIEVLGLILFIIGNLGTRFLALFGAINFVKKKFWKIPQYSFIFGMALISLAIPIFFIQKGTNWNTIQFFYYFMYFVAIFTGSAILFLYKKLPKLIAVLIIGTILVITPVSAWTTFRNAFYPKPPARLSSGELEALSYLKNQPEGIVLTYPFDKNLKNNFTDPYPLFVYETTAYVSAFSEKPTFLEDEIQQEIFQNDYKKRLAASQDFFRGRDLEWSKTFLHDNSIRYIYLPKIFKAEILADQPFVERLYDNNEVDIYEVLN